MKDLKILDLTKLVLKLQAALVLAALAVAVPIGAVVLGLMVIFAAASR